MNDVCVYSVETAGCQAPNTALRIVIPGGEGHLGKILTRYLSGMGHRLTTFTRNPHSFAASPDAPGQRTTIHWDGRNLADWVEQLEGADVLINLSGRSVDCRYNLRNRLEILQSRVQSTRVLGRAVQIVSNPPRTWLNASTATIYRDSYDREMTESAGELGGSEQGVPASWRFSIEVADQWEHTLFQFCTPKTRKIAMRTAMVMSVQDGGVFPVLLRLARMGLAGAWGSGKQWMSWIHELDFCRAVEFLMERPEIRGVVNVAAPVPLPNQLFLAELREAWGIGFGLPATEWMLELGAVFLRTETELLLKSRRVSPEVLNNHGFQFLFPEWPEAVRELLSRRRKNTEPGRERREK
jgi:uncharacterized protein